MRPGNVVPHQHFHFSGIIQYKTTPSLNPFTVVILFLSPSPAPLPPSCSPSSALPCVCGCFRAWQEAQIRGLKLDQIFSRYRFLRVPGFPISSTQLLSIPLSFSANLTRWPSLTAVTNKVVHVHGRPRTYVHGGIIN